MISLRPAKNSSDFCLVSLSLSFSGWRTSFPSLSPLISWRFGSGTSGLRCLDAGLSTMESWEGWKTNQQMTKWAGPVEWDWREWRCFCSIFQTSGFFGPKTRGSLVNSNPTRSLNSFHSVSIPLVLRMFLFLWKRISRKTNSSIL